MPFNQNTDKIFKIIGIILIIGGVIVPACLSIIKIISESLFVVVALVFMGAGFLIYKIDEIVEFKTKWFELKTLKKEIFAKAEEVKKISKEVDQNKQELRQATRVFIETFYLSLETRNRFPIPEKISQKIIENLNILSNFAIENESEGEEWMKKIQELLNQELKK